MFYENHYPEIWSVLIRSQYRLLFNGVLLKNSILPGKNLFIIGIKKENLFFLSLAFRVDIP